MKLMIKDDEFEDGLHVVLKILGYDFELVDFYIDDKEIIHVTFKRKDNDD